MMSKMISGFSKKFLIPINPIQKLGFKIDDRKLHCTVNYYCQPHFKLRLQNVLIQDRHSFRSVPLRYLSIIIMQHNLC